MKCVDKGTNGSHAVFRSKVRNGSHANDDDNRKGPTVAMDDDDDVAAETGSNDQQQQLPPPQQHQQQQQQLTYYQGQFLEAIRNGNACQLHHLLNETQTMVDVNGYNVDGQTALHQCCLSGNLELVKLLVKFGADIRLTNRDGWSALHLAAWKGHRDIALYLINAHYQR